MKKILLSLLLLSVCGICFAAHPVDSLFIDTRAAFSMEYTPSSRAFTPHFKGEHLNLNIYGHIAPNLDYRVRQNFNKNLFDPNNLLNATDFLYINWKASERFRLLVGKYAVLIGGYEYDALPVDVYYYSMFCNNLYQGFTMSILGTWVMAPGQELTFQFCDSPLSKGFKGVFAYNLAWMGHFAKWWNTIYSVNFVQDEYHRMNHYVALGNNMLFGPVLWDVDFLLRHGFGQKHLFSDWSVITKLIWSIGKWNLCTKIGFESNAEDNYDANGMAYDLVIPPGTNYFYYGAGVEFFPLPKKSLRLHAVIFGDNNPDIPIKFDIGVTWRFRIIKH